MSYPTVKLKDISLIKTGKLDSNAAVADGVYPFFTCDPNTLRINDWAYDTEAVLLAGNNASGNYTAKYYKGKFNAYQRVYIIETADAERLNTRYLCYAMNQQLRLLKTMSSGSTTKFLTLGMLHGLDIPLPVIEVQDSIVTILSSYDDLIENNQKQIKLLEEAAQRLYKEWFIDLRFPGHTTTPIVDGVPEGWRRERLVDLVDVQYGYAFDGSLFNTAKNGMPIIRIRNIPSGNTDDYTTEEADSQYIVHNGDILVGMDGEFHINSWSGPDAYLVQRTCSFRPNNSEMKGYLLQAIYEPIKYFENTVVGATVAHLGKKHIDTINVLTCPTNLYVPLQDYYEQRQLLLNQNWLLAEARDRLLPKLMSGEIEV
ncbi:MAG: restriction endonuclease subunit S [bacterium]|nr:restriction endonuclease subunit S [bacterium]